jgi:nicotinate-nucleotide adenylyltransferase
MRPIGIFGGTFDPIHYGHLRTALELKARVGLAAVHFVPVANPPHRAAPLNDGKLRLRMVEAAIGDEPGFVADDRELKRPGVSYTVDTLGSFRGELGAARPLCLLLGMDAFLGLPQWHRWRELLELAHVVVAHRPGWEAPGTGELGDWLRTRAAPDVTALATRPAGFVHVEPVTQLEISSTDLRDTLRAGRDPKYLVPDGVRQIILETECYAESL